ncbi:DUF2298 domain-containing protein [bacterium]|nr:DUF2298 domain-containing protein [bacterium]
MKKTKKIVRTLTKKIKKKPVRKTAAKKPVVRKKTVVKSIAKIGPKKTVRTAVQKKGVKAVRKTVTTVRRRRSRGFSLRLWIEKQWQAIQGFTQANPEAAWLGVVMVFAMIFRLIQPDWYMDRQFHPDERWIFGVVSQLSYPEAPTGLQYGTFPLYLLALIKDFVAAIAAWFGPMDTNRFVIWSGRMLSAFFDLGTIVFTYLLGVRILGGQAGRRLGLLAAALLSFTVLNIQMAHFFVVDVPLGMLTMGTIYWAVAMGQTGERKYYILAGVFLGLAAATKTSSAPLVLAVGIGHLLALTRCPVERRLSLWQDLAMTAGITLAVFFIAMPHAILDWDRFWTNQNEQQRILVTGKADVPYNRQYLFTVPYLYYFKNLIRYTMGHLLGTISVLAFLAYPVAGMVRLLQAAWTRKKKVVLKFFQATGVWWIVLGFSVPYFLIVGNSFAKFNRYMLPLTPVFCLLSAHLLLGFIKAAPVKQLRQAAVGFMLLVAGAAFLWSLAFVSTYQNEHPWIAASRWIQEELPTTSPYQGKLRPTSILNEEWGDDLPTHVKGMHPKRFRMNKFPVQEPDTPRKREIIISMLQKNDLIVMADTRAHAVYRRLIERYPINAAYYELMFEEQLGFKLAADFSNYPRLFGKMFPDDKADESFTLYDHPHVFLFQRQGPELRQAELTKRLDTRIAEIKARASGQPKPDLKTTQPGKKVAPLAVATPIPTVINANIGKSQGSPKFILGKLNSFTAALAWILVIEIIGLLTIPLCLSLFPRLPDSGVALSKIVGTLVLTWATWMLVSAGIMRHLQGTTFLVLLILGGASLYWASQRRTEITEFFRTRGKFWMSAEAVFLIAFVGYMLTKMYNPDINNPWGQGYNGGGEPMGVSFFTAVYKSLHFPPFDPWLSGYSINYYYYGQVILGILAKLIGAAPEYSYQICIAFLFALTMTGVYGLGVGLTGKRRWGIAAAVAAAMFGNLHTFFYLLEPFTRHMHWNDMLGSVGKVWTETIRHAGRFEFIWNPTRLIKGTINEMPWFSFLYGDLHAHIIAIPYSLPIIGWGLNVLLPANQKNQLMPEATGRNGTERGLTFFIIALTLGSLSAINTWNFPPYAFLILGVLAAKALEERKGKTMPWRALGIAGLAWVRLVIGGLFLFFFFHKNFTPQSTSLAFVNPAVRTHIKEFLIFFGLPVFVLVTFWGMQLVPQGAAFLKKLGWAAKSRKVWWVKILRVLQTFWEKYPIVVYGVLSVLVGALLLTLFNQPLLALLSVMMIIAVYVLGWQSLTPQLRMAMILAVIGLGIVLGCELVHIRDFMGVGGDMSRMNTVFKFYMVAWIYFALSSATFLAAVFSGKKETAKVWSKFWRQKPWWWLPGGGVGVLLLWGIANYYQEILSMPWLAGTLFVCIIGAPVAWAVRPKQDYLRLAWVAVLIAIVFVLSLYSPISLYNRMRLCSEFKNPTLSGFAYLQRMLPKEAAALRWINENIKNADIVLEAPGYRGYNCFDTRIAIFTGQPTLIGWIGQEEQMRYDPELTGSHTRDAERIYRSLDSQEALAVMDRYQVEYVFVGENERKAFSGPGLKKFGRFMDIAYEDPAVTIYQRRCK